jgi:Arc/MetJ family transcription regulator
MRTNIVLDDRLVKEAFRHSGAKTKRELVHEALSEFVANHGRRDLSLLRGRVKFAPGYDYKAARRGKAS